MMDRSVAVMIVTHNSAKFFRKCIAALTEQSVCAEAIAVIDCGSADTDYLKLPEISQGYKVDYRHNIGFCAANNLAWENCWDYKYVLLLNPDAFLPRDFIAQAIGFMEKSENARVGAITGALLGYDIDADRPTMLIDSTGITQNWFGRFQDRDQGRPIAELGRYKSPEEVTAICGALMFCRNEALKEISRAGNLLDPDFFMYKEDIDLSWRLREAGWKILFHPGLWAYHCRGWRSRSHVPRSARVLSSKNELRLFKKHRSPYLIYAALKLSLVRLVDF